MQGDVVGRVSDGGVHRSVEQLLGGLGHPDVTGVSANLPVLSKMQPKQPLVSEDLSSA